MMQHKKIPLTIWLNVPSFHQTPLLRSLIATGDVDIQVVFSRSLGAERIALGWENDTVGYPNCILDSNRAFIQAFELAWKQRNRIHIVNGFLAEPTITAALIALRLAGAHYLNYAEAPNWLIARSWPKKLVKGAFSRWAVQSHTGLLAISSLAKASYAHLGYSPDYIYDFGYFISSHAVLDGKLRNNNCFEILYVGQLVHRKGVDLLLEAILSLLPSYPLLSLTLIGDGNQRAQFSKMASSYADRIHFIGVLPSDQILARMKESFVLVLPSRFDGWGVVVNEALSAGVPVIASDACGAADLLRDGENGYIFAANDVQSLRTCLESILSLDKKIYLKMRENARDTGRNVAAETIAPYLVNCLRHMLGQITEKPIAPWKS